MSFLLLKMNYHRYSLLLDNYGDADKIDDLFLMNLYIYFLHGGYYNIIINDVISWFISIFLMLFINFLYMCIDFKGLFTNSGDHDIHEFINIHNYWNLGPFMIMCFVIFGIYILFRFAKTLMDIKKYKKTKLFYNKTLNIRDMEIRTYTWDDIIRKLIESCHNTSNVNIYTVSSRIMKMDNILISLFDNKLIDFGYINQLLEWNIKFCFIHSLQKDTNKISDDILSDLDKYQNTVKKRIIIVSIINFLFMPFILLFVAFYNIIKYGEVFYNSPKLIASRRWTNQSKWRFRFYNELPHVFNTRMELASVEMRKYFEQFNHRLLEIISRFIVFVVGSMFLFLVFIVFVNENNLTNKGFFGFQPVLWYITIFATLLAIFRRYTKSNLMTKPEECLNEVNEYLKMIPDETIAKANYYKVHDKMSTYYQYHIICLIKEIVTICITPIYYMTTLYNKHKEISQFIAESIETHYVMGNVSKYCIFNNYSFDVIDKFPKLKHSIESFQQHHPSWNPTLDVLTNSEYQPGDNHLELPTTSLLEVISTNPEFDESD